MLARALLLLFCHVAETGRAPTWDHCGCRWAEWRAWSVCSASCGKGLRLRSRAVWNHNYPQCEGFSVCATDDMAYDIGLCNTICYHGVYAGGHCMCQTGWSGRCCNKEINCGNPGILKDGYIEKSSFSYNSEITYHCNESFNLTGGTKTRRCQSNATWSGQKPKCSFVNSCRNNPCMNQGTCISGIDDYKCLCAKGFNGSNCQLQIDCGNPGTLKDGYIEKSSFTYNSEIIYHCNESFNLTGGTKTRRCQSNATWSGKKPKCAFVNSCLSNPCMNQGTCTNNTDDYKCVCSKGFNGSKCQLKPFSQIHSIPLSFGCKGDYCRKSVLLTLKESNQQ